MEICAEKLIARITPRQVENALILKVFAVLSRQRSRSLRLKQNMPLDGLLWWRA